MLLVTCLLVAMGLLAAFTILHALLLEQLQRKAGAAAREIATAKHDSFESRRKHELFSSDQQHWRERACTLEAQLETAQKEVDDLRSRLITANSVKRSRLQGSLRDQLAIKELREQVDELQSELAAAEQEAAGRLADQRLEIQELQSHLQAHIRDGYGHASHSSIAAQ